MTDEQVSNLPSRSGFAGDWLAALEGAFRHGERLAGIEGEALGEVVRLHRASTEVFVVRAGDLSRDPLGPHLEQLSECRAALLFVGDPAEGLLSLLPERLPVAVVSEGASRPAVELALLGLFERLELRQRTAEKARMLERSQYELGELVEIARALTQERDIGRLLSLILEKSRFITGADAGSIYVVEDQQGKEGEGQNLHFMLSQNDSCSFESREFLVPVSTRSIAGYAVVTRAPIHIPDVYAIPEGAPYGFDASFDRRVGYRTRSMITVPLVSAEDEVIGVIQLINKKRDPRKTLRTPEDFQDEVVPFDHRSTELLATLASQAGIALENALLYDEIKRIFEGFVRASVQAIEQRDPTTSGHSLRVSVLSCRLAEVVDGVSEGPYADVQFTRRDLKELEYAALLHDFGKIGVREQVLVKAKKLYPHELESIRHRIHYALKANESDVLAKKIERIRLGASEADLRSLDEELAARRAELEDALRTVLEANEPTVLAEGDFGKIAHLGEMTYRNAEGQLETFLRPSEVLSLQVTRGSLSPSEMEEIRSHVTHTFNFLSRIPWGKSFARIPEIAGAHHERVNGTGYPARRSAEEIPLRARIMSVADIFDALTARDRPYKKAVPVDRALAILGFEVDAGHVDAELVRIFRDAQVFRAVESSLEY